MNKREFLEKFQKETSMNSKEANICLDAFIKTLTEGVKEHKKIQFLGFGSFELREKAERLGKHPKTKENIVIPATTTMVFKAGKSTKDFLNN